MISMLETLVVLNSFIHLFVISIEQNVNCYRNLHLFYHTSNPDYFCFITHEAKVVSTIMYYKGPRRLTEYNLI